MSKAMADLLNDHETILTAIQVLERMRAALETNASVNMQDMHAFIRFVDEFIDECHHGKEEIYLFPAMAAAGIPEKGGPIGVLLSEHAQGRQLIRDMESAITTDLDKEKLARVMRAYASLLRVHVRKENTIMFPMAERALAEAQLEKVYAGFEEHVEMVIGQGRLAELHAILARLQEEYRPK